MWHLFDGYKRRHALPRASQLNLIARILNNLTPGPGIKMRRPDLPTPAAPVEISVDEAWLNAKIGGGGGGGGGGGIPTGYTEATVITGVSLTSNGLVLTTATGLVKANTAGAISIPVDTYGP